MSEKMIDTDSHTIGDAGEENLHRIHSSNMQALGTLVADTNRRLSRAGIDERFEYEIRARHDVVIDGLVDTSFDIALRRPRIGYAEWALAATVVVEEAGTILRTVPGEDLSHWNRPDAHHCDHCNRTQYRTRSYALVRPVPCRDRRDPPGRFELPVTVPRRHAARAVDPRDVHRR